METTNRRGFVGGLLAISFGAGSIEIESADLPTDVKKLCHWYGSDAVLRHLQIILSDGADITFQSLRSSLGREKRRNDRQAKARNRREHHNNAVIYRGPVLIPYLRDLLAGCRPVNSDVTGHCLLIGELDKFWLGELQLPRATRLLIDNRRGLRSPCMGEFVSTAKDRYPYRLHLYQPSQWQDGRDPSETAVVLSADEPERVRLSEERLDELYQHQDKMEN